MDSNLMADKISPEITNTMSDAEKYRLRRMFDLMDESQGHIGNISDSMNRDIVDNLATSKAGMTSVEEGMKASLENDLAIAGLHDDEVHKAATKALDQYIDQSIQSILRAGSSPVMSDPERIYYDILSPADAYYNSVLMNPVGQAPLDTLTSNDRGTGKELVDTGGTFTPVPPADTAVPPAITVPPTVPVSPSPIVIQVDGFTTYYVYITDTDGVVHSIPVVLADGDPVPEEYHVNPYVPPVSPPPPTTCIGSLPTANGGGNTNYFPYIEVAGTKYQADVWSSLYDPATVQSTTIRFNGTNCKLALFSWPYPDTVPPVSVPPVLTGPNVDNKCVLPDHQFAADTFLWWRKIDVGGQSVWMRDYFPPGTDEALTYEGWTRNGPAVVPNNVINGLFAQLTCDNIDWSNWIDCNIPDSKHIHIPQPPASPPEPPCPPGCVKLGETNSTDPIYKVDCGKWDDMPNVCVSYIGGINSNQLSTNPINTGDTQVNNVAQSSPSILQIIAGALTATPSVFSSIFNTGTENLLLSALQSVISGGQQSATSIAKAAAEECGCSIPGVVNPILTLTLSGWAERLSAAPVTYLTQNILYGLQFCSPQFLPTQSDFDNMYLTNEIDEKQWTCYTKALGNLPNTHHASMHTKRSRIDPRAAVFLNRYEKLNTDDYKKEMRSLGFIDDKDKKHFEDSLVNLPGVSDLTRFMVRDVEDEEIIKKYKLFDQDEFDKKYTGNVKLWAKSQGIPDDVFQKYWTAHWQYMSNTEVYQAIRRLRPGRRKDGLTFTKEDAEYLLRSNDFAPGQIDYVLALSYEVPTRTDIKRGYNIDALKREEVIEYLQDEGYEKDDAETIAKIFDVEKDLYKLQINMRYSAFTIKQLSNMYANGEITRDIATDTMRELGLKQEQIDKAIKTADTKAKAISTKKCLASIKKRYMNGAISEADMPLQLIDLGIDDQRIRTLEKAWKCEFASMEKEPAAGKAVEWYVKGIIGIGELTFRLTNLHYNEQTISSWISEALMKQREAYEKEQKRRMDEEIKRQKEADRVARQRKKEAEALLKANKS